MSLGDKIAGSFYVSGPAFKGKTPRVLMKLSADGGFMHSDQTDFLRQLATDEPGELEHQHFFTSPAYGSWTRSHKDGLVATSVAIVTSDEGKAIGFQNWRFVMTFDPKDYDHLTIEATSVAKRQPDENPTEAPKKWFEFSGPGKPEGWRIAEVAVAQAV